LVGVAESEFLHRQTFADCGQTIADILDAGKLAHGVSFKKGYYV
jgi:phosphopentomutase